MRDVTILIKTSERPASLRRLLSSILDRGYTYPVLVADDSREPYRDAVLVEFGHLVAEYVVLPFDVGVSAGRNAMLQMVRTLYFVLCDDDFIFDERTDLSHTRRLLDAGGLDLLGGACYDRAPFSWREFASCAMKLDWPRLLTLAGLEVPRRLCFNFESCGSGHWKLVDAVYTPSVVLCDFSGSFFLAKTDRVVATVEGWDASRKLGEHRAFFFKAKQRGLKVGHTEEVGVTHLRELPGVYNKYRLRNERMVPEEFVQPTARERFRSMLVALGRIYRHYRSGRRPPRARSA